jgi:hypothetical protein
VEVETKNSEDAKSKEICCYEKNGRFHSTRRDDINSEDQTPRLKGDGKKRGVENLNNNDDDSNEYPQKSHKCDNDGIEIEPIICDTTNDMMELDESQQELFKATYKENLQRYDVKNVAINRFLEAMTKQQQKNTKNEHVEHVGELHEISDEKKISSNLLLTNSEVPFESSLTSETTPMNMNMIQTKDIAEQIITNTLITVHDHCQSNDQGIEELLHDDDQAKGWNFRRGLQDRLLLKEVSNVEERDAEISIEVNGTAIESNVQSTRPVIWGTCKYQSLWAMASAIDEDLQMNIASSNPLEEELWSPEEADINEASFPITPEAHAYKAISINEMMNEEPENVSSI